MYALSILTEPLNSIDLIINSPHFLPHIYLWISYKDLLLGSENNLHLINLSILITCLLDNEWRL